jgi:hypothetical protein
MGCPPEWKNCINVGKWDDPMHKIFNSMSREFKKSMGGTSKITASGRQLVAREHELMDRGIPELQVHKILESEFKNAKVIIKREHQLMAKGIPELKAHSILFKEFR